MCKSCHVRVRQLRRQAKLFTECRGWQNFNFEDPLKMGTPGSHLQLNWEPHLEAESVLYPNLGLSGTCPTKVEESQ